jgi:phosphatidylserine/phosphatidylglycerophosphate/cardiolipin synthase-like enzyme/uncharacterized membrane protein YdjX (TVP38/TMEM64 family)
MNGTERGGSSSAERGNDPRRLLEESRTCWRRARADRVAFLVDGETYFAALADTIERAERQILMIGWDFHSRIRLRRDGGDDGNTAELAALLDSAVQSRRTLQVYILGWDFAMIYALEREALPLYRLGLRTHRRVRFRLDGRHPVGASHHQKIVVIDDAVAFSGGFDITACRWDTREHLAADARRSDPGFPRYGAYHDVQMAVSGEAARALAELARERWRRATDQRLPPPEAAHDPWPESLEPALLNIDVGIARTEPAFKEQAEVREVEALYLEAIHAARRSIYLENQYLTAARVSEALAERLRERDGPEVLIIGPRRCSGWLEEGTMGVLRARLVRRLREADRYDRLRIYSPLVPGLGERPLIVHSKVLVIDDRLLRIGSANLSNRSMGLDTECDLALEGDGAEGVRAAIEGFRNDLLAEHLGTTAERVSEAITAHASLLRAVESLRQGERTLERLETDVPEWLEEIVPESAILDPERPVDLDTLIASFVPEELPEPHRSLLARVGVTIGVLLALVIAWRWTPLGDWITPAGLASLTAFLREAALGPVVAFTGFAIAGCLMVPVTVMVVAAALVFGWRTGFLIALSASLLSAALGYELGRLLWRDAVRRLAGRRLNRVSQALGHRGTMSMVLVRLVPVAPFTIVNLVAGASHIRFRHFLLGTLVGMAPGTLALTFFAERAERAVTEPGLATVLTALLVGTLLWLGVRRLQKTLMGLDRPEQDPDRTRGP